MIRAAFLPGCVAFLALTAAAAAQPRVPGSGGISFRPLVQPQLIAPAPAPTRFPLTYSDQVAQSLGLRDGNMNLVQPGASPYAPSVSFNGSMLRLRWRP